MVGTDPKSEGFIRVRELGMKTAHPSVNGLLPNVLQDSAQIALNATSAHVHQSNLEPVGGLGAGPGNMPMAVFMDVFDRMGLTIDSGVFKLMDTTQEIVFPMMDHVLRVDRSSPTLRFGAAYYSLFLPHAEWLGRKYGIRSRDIVVERGTKKIGGQENMVDDAALTMMQQRRVAT